MLNDNPVEKFEAERIAQFDNKPLLFDCELEYESVTSTERLTDSVTLPYCGITFRRSFNTAESGSFSVDLMD